MMTYVPRGPKEILESFIWVKGGHSMPTYVSRGARTPRDILESFIWVKGGHKVTYDPL